MMRTRILNVAVLATALTVSAALAQQQQPPGTQRVSGTIERVDGNTIFGKGSDGSAVTLKLADNVAITAVMKATFADIKPGDYVGTGAVPQADGSQKAVELRIFPRPQADGGHQFNHREVDGRRLPGHGLIFKGVIFAADKSGYLGPVIEARANRQHRHDAQEQHQPPGPEIFTSFRPCGRNRRRRHGVVPLVWLAR